MDLSYKQRLFVEAYLGKAAGNASEAARIAGYAHPGVLGPRLVGKSSIRAAIDARLKDAAMSANETLARISEFAAGSLEPFVEVKNDGSWTIDLKRAKRAGKIKLLKKLKAGKDGPEIEIHSPLEALDKLAKYHGLYIERKEITQREGLPRVVILPDNKRDPRPE